MFGLGKSTSPKATSPKKNSYEPFDFKQFMLNHCEKMILALFILSTGWLVYDGFTGIVFEKSKTPDDLQQQTAKVKREIVDIYHPDAVKGVVLVKGAFAKKSDESRRPTSSEPYSIGRLDNKDIQKGGKRGDPEILPPLDVQVHSFSGTIAYLSNKAAPVDLLENAPPITEDRRRPRGRGVANAPTVERKLAPKYNKGFEYIPGATIGPVMPGLPPRIRPADLKPVPSIVVFNAITAVVDHEKLVENYKREFEHSAGYDASRDSPNYLGYEVQRVDVTDDPRREILENQWQDLKGCSPSSQLKLKDLWAGDAKEVCEAEYTMPEKLTMSIPPVLLEDYDDIATHPLVPQIKKLSSMGGPGSMGGRYGPPPSANGGPPGMYGPPAGTTAGPGGYGAAAVSAEDQALILSITPKAAPFSKYKLIRFYDFLVKPGHVYKYRIRIHVEDPNFPRLESLSPKTSSMKAEVVARVQQLEDAHKGLVAKAGPNKKLLSRNGSKRTSIWCQPSESIGLKIPTKVFASRAEGTWNSMKLAGASKGELGLVESMPAKATLVYGEWDKTNAVLVTKKVQVERGVVLSGLSSENLDVIHPITKVIKQLAGFRFNTAVTIADISGGQSLAAEKRANNKDKDPLPSGGEVVAYDPRSGDLVISREFTDMNNYRMYSFADEVEAAEPAPTPASTP